MSDKVIYHQRSQIIWALPSTPESGDPLRATNDLPNNNKWKAWHLIENRTSVYAFGTAESGESDCFYASVTNDNKIKLTDEGNEPNEFDAQDRRFFRYFYHPRARRDLLQHCATGLYVTIKRNSIRPIHRLILTNNPEEAYDWQIY